MEQLEISEEEQRKGQREINEWFENLPDQAENLLEDLENKIAQLETFDLLSNISFYNHLHDAKQYSDYREDKMFVISELIALIALKRDYVSTSSTDIHASAALIQEIQDLGYKYFGLITLLQIKENDPKDDHSVQGIASRTMRDETIIRNPGLPEHHFEISTVLYAPIEIAIKEKFGFTVKESILIRKSIIELINKKVNEARVAAEQKSIQLAMEVFKFRATKVVPENSSISEENLIELNKLSRKEIKQACYYHCGNEMFFHFGECYTLTAQELSDYTGVEIPVIESFLKHFSCTFPAVAQNEQLVVPNSILKTKPIVAYKGRYLIPSYPLLIWCVEPVIEDYIKSVNKLQNRFKSYKHDFLLQKGFELFATIFGKSAGIFTNLFYDEKLSGQSRCETDGIITYERTMFIIEAKGHRITQAAKQGRIDRTEKHLEEIVQQSYEQGLRTLNFINSKPVVDFFTKQNKKISFSRNDFDEIVLISLVLEPIGSVTPLIRATNELGYFKQNIFPWIISIYDLIVIADHIEIPAFLLHYIKRRKEFLQRKLMFVFEETDLLAYYLLNRLYIEGMYKDAEGKNVDRVYLDNETDAINNYYMHKYKLKSNDPPKLKPNLPDNILNILRALEKTQFSHKQEIMLRLLDMAPRAIDQFNQYIEKIKGMYVKDGKIHDCSMLTHIWGEQVGFTFMAGPDKLELDKSLYYYCQFKLEELKAKVWIGFGDMERSKNEFSIQSAFVAINK